MSLGQVKPNLYTPKTTQPPGIIKKEKQGFQKSNEKGINTLQQVSKPADRFAEKIDNTDPCSSITLIPIAASLYVAAGAIGLLGLVLTTIGNSGLAATGHVKNNDESVSNK